MYSVLQGLTDMELLALNAWAEARGEPDPEMAEAAVCWTVMNRVRHPGWWGHNVRSVILCPEQYSWLLPGDKENQVCLKMAQIVLGRPKILPSTFQLAFTTAKGVMEGKIPSPVQGATNYFNYHIPWPRWAYKMRFICEIGNHRFYAPCEV